MSGVQGLVQDIGDKEKKAGQGLINGAQNRGYVRPDMRAAAEQAVQAVNLDLTVKAQGEYKIKFTTDGKSLDFITEAVKNSIEIENKNQTGQPKFPKTSFESSVR